MRIAAYDRLSPSAPIEAFPVTIEQKSQRVPAALMLLPVIMLLAVMAVPSALFVMQAAGEPTARALILERPVAAMQMALGILLWMALFAWPANRLMARLFSVRTVTIEAHRISVSDKGLFGTHAWSLPLASFDGLAHHVRATLSGTRHELILAHPDRDHSVLVAIGDRIGTSEVERVARLLGVREIPARQLYDRSRLPRPAVGGGIVAGQLSPLAS